MALLPNITQHEKVIFFHPLNKVTNLNSTQIYHPKVGRLEEHSNHQLV